MREWRFWDWVAYAALFLATALEALEAGLRQAPKVASHMPDILSADWLSFAPFTLVCVATVILVFRAASHEFHMMPASELAGAATAPAKGVETLSTLGKTFPCNPPDSFEWLGKAAQEVYGKLGKCRVRDMVEAVGKDDNGITNVVARMIAQFADIYGHRAPSSVTAKIEHEEIDELSFHIYGARLYTPGYERMVWTNLMVKREDFARAADAIMNARHSSALQIR
jgi:hypothetical protein